MRVVTAGRRRPDRKSIQTPAGRRAISGVPSEGVLRVLMITPRYPPDVGGVERHVYEVARRLPNLGFHVTVLCTDRTGSLPGTQHDSDVEVRRVRAWPRNRDYYVAPRIWKEMSRGAWDVVHVQSYHTLVAPLAMLRAIELRVPFVLTFHGGGHSSRLRHGLRPAQRWVLGPLLRRAARLVAVARFEIEKYGSELGVAKERFVLIPNGTEYVVPSSRTSSDPKNGTVVASIGRLERYKGHHRVLDAFPYVLRRCPNARLWIVGDGPERDALGRHVEALGVGDRVEFRSVPAGDGSAMAELLAGTAVVVSMSDFETHPLAALEVAAAGRPLVVSDATGLSELVADGLAYGIPPRSSAESIARAIVDEMTHGRRRAPTQLSSWDDCAVALANLYREVSSAGPWRTTCRS